MDAATIRSHSRILACWWIRRCHSKTPLPDHPSHQEWLLAQLSPPLRSLYGRLFAQNNCHSNNAAINAALGAFSEIAQSRVLNAGDPPPSPLDVVNRVHEFLLWLETPKERRVRGAYYTPQSVASVLIELAHERLLKMNPGSLGIFCPSVRLLDPAAGTGAFVSAALAKKTSQGLTSHDTPQTCLSVEIDPETHAIGAFCLANDHLGVPVDQLPRYQCSDALSHPEIAVRNSSTRPFNLIVGNPPYSALRGSNTKWLDELLRGRDPIDGSPRANYLAVQKQSALHRKHTLADDYVRFLRLAHWHIERAGHGVIALILNHNILENTSFRGLRESLSQAFNEILFLDLHGNAKRRELTPQGTRDESIFNIEQGTMVAVLAKWPESPQNQVRMGHLYGLRDEKTASFVRRSWETELQTVLPTPPHFFFHCSRRALTRAERAYRSAPSLTEVMPIYSSAIVTARDALVIDYDLARLKERIGAIRNLEIPDGEIRKEHFGTQSNARYLPGDTRSWRLNEARRKLASEGEDAIQYVGHWYRPWDYRWLAYSKHLVDWRRERFTPLLLDGKNLAIVARRQSPPGAACNFVWTSNTIVLDGLLRSDNRGTEYVFPLFCDRLSESKYNFECSVRDHASDSLGLDETGLFHVILAVLHSKSYQTAFQDQLCRDFPRILLPRGPQLAGELAKIGRQIVKAECMNAISPKAGETFPWVGIDGLIAPGFPKFRNHQVRINSDAAWKAVDDRIWNLRAGAHQPTLRWLKQRRGTMLSPPDIAHVSRILDATAQLLSAYYRLNDLLPTQEALVSS